MNSIFNWGIIGLGNIAETFANDLGLLPNANLYAVASRSQQKADLFAKKHGATYAYGCYEDIVNNKNIDIIYIATPHSHHFENAAMCLTNKIPVLCEKPLAINSAEVKRMVDLSKSNNTFLMEALWTMFLPSMEKTLELVNEKAIGNIKIVRADFGIKAPKDINNRLFNNALGGGSLLDVGIYPVFLSLLILGRPSLIKAAAYIGSTNVDESCGITMIYDTGQDAVLFSSIVARTAMEAEIIGDKGRIIMHTGFFMPTKLTLIRDNAGPEIIEPEYKGKGYVYEAEEAMHCIENGMIESKKMSHSYSIQLIDILDTIRNQCGIHYPGHDL
jgi:predicted dehydrogenase